MPGRLGRVVNGDFETRRRFAAAFRGFFLGRIVRFGGVSLGKGLDEASELVGVAVCSPEAVEFSGFDEGSPSPADSGGDSVSRVGETSQAFQAEFVGKAGNQLREEVF